VAPVDLIGPCEDAYSPEMHETLRGILEEQAERMREAARR
jgi:hypothetical protein